MAATSSHYASSFDCDRVEMLNAFNKSQQEVASERGSKGVQKGAQRGSGGSRGRKVAASKLMQCRAIQKTATGTEADPNGGTGSC